MKCPQCKQEMHEYKIPVTKLAGGATHGFYHMCKNKKCLWFGIKRTEAKT